MGVDGQVQGGLDGIAVSAAGVFVVFLDTTVVNIAFPALSADFPGVSRAGLSWVLNAYAVVFGALLVTSGRLADARGRRHVPVRPGAVRRGVRALRPRADGPGPRRGAPRQAVGAALLVPASLALLLPGFPASRRASAVGLWGAAGAVAAASGPVLGGLLVQVRAGAGCSSSTCRSARSRCWRAGVLRESTGTAPDAARPTPSAWCS